MGLLATAVVMIFGLQKNKGPRHEGLLDSFGNH
jgi:hypothetical protein